MRSGFNKVFFDGEWHDGFQVIDTAWSEDGICKRCGESFVKRYREQVFCSKDCVSKYRVRLKEMEAKHGKKFREWLNN